MSVVEKEEFGKAKRIASLDYRDFAVVSFLVVVAGAAVGVGAAAAGGGAFGLASLLLLPAPPARRGEDAFCGGI